jgi:Bacterial PH domain
VGDHRAKIQRASSQVLQPGEKVLAAVRAAAESSPIGALGGLVTILALAANDRDHARDQGFPASLSMILAVTDRRLLVFRQALFNGTPKFQGGVPFEAVRRVMVQRRGLSPRLRFVMASGAEVTFTTYRLDHPERFAQALNRAREAWAAVAPALPPPPATPVVPPPPLPS